MAPQQKPIDFYPYRSVGSAVIYGSPSLFYPRAQTYWKRSYITRTGAFLERIIPQLTRVDMDEGKGKLSVERVTRPVSPPDLRSLLANRRGTRPWQMIWLLLRYLEEGDGPFSPHHSTVAQIDEDVWMIISYSWMAKRWVLDVNDASSITTFRPGTYILVY